MKKKFDAVAILPPHPLDVVGVVKIALGRDASAALAACGPFHLAMISKADATAPQEIHGEMILLCLPLDKATAGSAAGVAMGTHRAVKTKPAGQGTGKHSPQERAEPP